MNREDYIIRALEDLKDMTEKGFDRTDKNFEAFGSRLQDVEESVAIHEDRFLRSENAARAASTKARSAGIVSKGGLVTGALALLPYLWDLAAKAFNFNGKHP